MKFIVALSSLVLVSLSSVSPCLAVNQLISRLPDQSWANQPLPNQPEAIEVAGFSLGDVINAVGSGLNLVQQQQERQAQQEARERAEQEHQVRLEQERQERLESERKHQAEVSVPEESTQLPTQPPSSPAQNSPQSVNRNLYQELNKRGGETHEQWYERIDPIIMNTPREEYRAWRAALSTEDREAYDVITRRKNLEAANQFDRVLPAIIEDATSSQDATTRPQECWQPDGRGNWNRC